MGRAGRAITIVTAVDLLKLREIESKLGHKLPRVPVSSLNLAPVAPLQEMRAAMGSRPAAQPRPVAGAPIASAGGAPARRRRRRGRRSGGASMGQAAAPA
jgi:hypothetical protein